MCQAYEAEYRHMCWLEDRSTREGYLAAKTGKPDTNPYDHRWQATQHKYWRHGYDCYVGGIVPRAVVEKENG